MAIASGTIILVLILLFCYSVFLILPRRGQISTNFTLILGGNIMPNVDNVAMTVGDKAEIKIGFNSARGHEVTAENIILSVDNSTTLLLEVDPTNAAHCFITALADGVGSLIIDADGHIGEGDSPIHGELVFTIAAEDAVAVGFRVTILPAP